MGDPEQIDHPYLDSLNNGLTYVIERFKGQQISGHVKLVKEKGLDLHSLQLIYYSPDPLSYVMINSLTPLIG